VGEGVTHLNATLTRLERIHVAGGDVLKALDSGDPFFNGFGEAYFSFIKHNFIKSWRCHRRATLNLIVPIGAVQFVTTLDGGEYSEFALSPDDNFCRLTVPPGVWLAFRGIGKNQNLILSISDLPHSPLESERHTLEHFSYDW
jgi:dTDP-4-dehydrorhamnose 3,5-epimerase